ncbi:hypothetical protein PV396_37765 [Streptomyces sp. ME02-8801-2C]|uniref:hypothetical protein n=1 Tax=Streptomyces sp. ME02-8801-2C TaxID=3028680 RepID=UPI0029A5E9CE|nr:hypothetical protein [Streptomyces sp. ME02-8801-2C]MDX3457637.1 hypothetical protein [Streptomyces sp. ME02-8801-2C]
MVGGAATLLAYSGLLAVSVHKETFAEAGWTSSAAARLSPYGTVAAEQGAVFVHALAQPLTWIIVLASLALVVLALLQPARRNQRLHIRPAGRVLSFRPRTRAPEPARTPQPAPLRQAR